MRSFPMAEDLEGASVFEASASAFEAFSPSVFEASASVSSFRSVFESSASAVFLREAKMLKSLSRVRAEGREAVRVRVSSERKYLEAECLPEHAAALDEILRGLTAHLDSSPARKKAFMARVAVLNRSVRAKRKNDDIQGQVIMKASEIRRLSTCAAQNHFFLQEASLLRWRLLLQRILQLLVKMSAEDRRRLYQRIDGRLWETLQWHQRQQQHQQQ